MIRVKKDRCGYVGYECSAQGIRLTDVFAGTALACDALPARTSFGDVSPDNYLDIPTNIAGFTMVENGVPDFSSLKSLYIDPSACYSSLDVLAADGARGAGEFIDLFNVYKAYNNLGLVKYKAVSGNGQDELENSAFFGNALLCYTGETDTFKPSLLEPAAIPYIVQPISISTTPINEQIIDIDTDIINNYFDNYDFSTLIEQFVTQEVINEIIENINIEEITENYVETYINNYDFSTLVENYLEENFNIQELIEQFVTQEVINEIIENLDMEEIIENYVETYIDNYDFSTAVETYITNNISYISHEVLISIDASEITNKIINSSVDIKKLAKAVADELPKAQCPPKDNN